MFPHKLGKRKPRVDARTPRIREFLQPVHLDAPSKQDWAAAGRVGYWGMMLNDSLGDCVIAAKGHAIILYTTLTGHHKNVILPDNVILQGYEAVGGYVPGKPSTDNGCDMLTAAQYYQSSGFGGHRISAFATVAPADIQEVQACINLFGLVDIGVGLPLSAQDQTGPGKVWDVPAGGAVGDGAPGSWGGHAIPVVAYDAAAKMYKVITWGVEQLMTERFFAAYCDEAYTYLSPDWIYAGLAPNRYELWQLGVDIGLVNAKAH